MNILIVIPSDKNLGPVNVVKYLLEAAKNSGDIAYFNILCINRETSFKFYGAKTFYLNERGQQSKKEFYQQLLIENKIDVVHSHGIRPDLMNYLWTPKNIKSITTIHNYPNLDYKYEYGSVKGWLYSFLHIAMIKRLNCVVGCSKSVSENLAKFNVNSITIQNGVLKEPNNKKNDSYVLTLLFLGRLIPRKNIDEFIEAAVILSNKVNAKFIVAGGAPPEVISQYKVNYPFITFLGNVDNPDDYISQCDVLVSCSKAEGFPLSVLEAIYLGKRVILSDIPPHLEIYQLVGNVAKCYQLGDADALATTVMNLEQTRQEESDKAKYAVSAQRMLSDYNLVYKDRV